MINFSFINPRKITNLCFIFGAPRGGTTWLWSMLESHPDCLPFINGVIKNDSGLYPTSESGVYVRFSRRKAKRLIIDFVRKNKKNLIFEKTPIHTLNASNIIKDFPHTKSILIYRNPVAIANSMIHSQMDAFKNHNLEKSINEVKKYYSALRKIQESNPFLVVLYEDLLHNPHNQLNRIFDYLNLDVNEINRIVEDNTKRTKVAVPGAFRKGDQQSFKRDLSKTQIDNIIEELKIEIKEFEMLKKIDK